MGALNGLQNVFMPLAATVLYVLVKAHGLPEVSNLVGYADYRYVALTWDYDDAADENLYGFQVRYCELQKWGPHRCKVKSLGKEMFSSAASSRETRQHNSYLVPGLRMSTNYTFEVRPVTSKRMDREYHNTRVSQQVVLATKGFSAKATLCLPTESEIEVSTGPYFGGRVGAESGEGSRCTVEGDPTSPRDVYTLRINHQECGSVVNETTVTTFVLVQENLPILTHSTRRFLVLCTVQPDTLTVRARLNLPHRSSNKVDDEEGEGSVSRAELSEEDEVEMAGRRRDSRMLKLAHSMPTGSPRESDPPGILTFLKEDSLAQVVVMMSLVLVVAVGCATTIWYSSRSHTTEGIAETADDTTSVASSMTCSSEPSVINFEIESVCGLSDNSSSRDTYT